MTPEPFYFITDSGHDLLDRLSDEAPTEPSDVQAPPAGAS